MGAGRGPGAMDRIGAGLERPGPYPSRPCTPSCFSTYSLPAWWEKRQKVTLFCCRGRSVKLQPTASGHMHRPTAATTSQCAASEGLSIESRSSRAAAALCVVVLTKQDAPVKKPSSRQAVQARRNKPPGWHTRDATPGFFMRDPRSICQVVRLI